MRVETGFYFGIVTVQFSWARWLRCRKCCSLTSLGAEPSVSVVAGPKRSKRGFRVQRVQCCENDDEGRKENERGGGKAPPSFLRIPLVAYRLQSRSCVFPKTNQRNPFAINAVQSSTTTYFNLDKTRQFDTQNSQITIANSLTSKRRTAADVLLLHPKIQLR